MIFEMASLLTLALLLDAVFGEPKRLWSRVPHPAVLMGKAVDALDRIFNEGEAQRQKGVVAIVLLTAGAIALGWLISVLPLNWLWSTLIAAMLIAQKSLSQHVLAVADALRGSTEQGRAAVAMIVGRDTSEMDGSDVSRAAIESAAENFSDGVVAPAFWFLIAGLPGIIAYKAINTADSMIGHRTPRHEEFGWAAAKLDDLVNWVPARLTAALIWMSHGRIKGLSAIRTDAKQHRSPNAGWPEAAMARLLDIALSGPRSYGGEKTDDPFVNPGGNADLKPIDIEAAVEALWRSWAVLLGIAVFLWIL